MKKIQGHYCRICGERKANEKFSGKGHAAHICKECAKLPQDKRNELQTITKIENLPFWLKKDQIAWLKKKKDDPREEVRDAAISAWEMRFPEADPRLIYEEVFYEKRSWDECIASLEYMIGRGSLETINTKLSSALPYLKQALSHLTEATDELMDEEEDEDIDPKVIDLGDIDPTELPF
jgi:hypothetical protein